jgi:CBS domain-containing protein
MRSPPVTASTSETVVSIAEKMITNDIGAVVILADGHPVGLITERDIIESILEWYDNPSGKLAGDIMSSPAIAVERDATLREAFETMKKRGVRRLGVTQNRELVGIVTERRLLDVVREMLKAIAENI